MKSNTFTISDLFSSNRRYIVPLFQRPYVWDLNSQWRPLWEDIADKTSQLLNPGVNAMSQPRSHFMGAVVLNQIPTYGKQVPAMDVIDGQQRLTTLQILFVALRDFARAAGVNDILNTLVQLTENNMLREQEVERYKVWPTTTDRAIFETIMTAGSPEALEQKYPLMRIKRTRRYYPRPKLVEAYLFFHQAISDYTRDVSDGLGDDDAPAEPPVEEVPVEELELIAPAPATAQPSVSNERLYGIMQALTKHLELVVIELEDRDDPQVIFETLNARGEPLLPSDLIRNFVFLTAARQQDNVTDLYATYWQPLDQPDPVYGPLWKQEVRQGRLTRPLIDLFFFHYLTYRTGQELLMTHVFKEFRLWWKNQSPQVESELRQIQKYSEIFKHFFLSSGETRLNICMRRLRILDTSTAYPLLLLILGGEHGTLTDNESAGILTDIESYLVRRQICGLTNKNYNRFFLNLLEQLRKVPAIARPIVRQLLNEQHGDSARWPNNDEFRQAWLNRPIYQVLIPQRIVMILEALEWQHYGSKQERAPFINNASYSIEHFMPQGYNEITWPLPHADEATRPAIIARRDQLKHTFGNLTLVTQPLNSALSNGRFDMKRKEIEDNSLLMLNKYFQRHQIDEWNEDRIVERGERLFAKALEIWPHPGIIAP